MSACTTTAAWLRRSRQRPSRCSRCTSQSIRRLAESCGRCARAVRVMTTTVPPLPCPPMNRVSCRPGTARLHSRARGRSESGCAQVDGPLAGFGAVAGVYSVGWMLGLVAALLVQGFYTVRHGSVSMSKGARFAPFIVAAVVLVSGMLLSLVEWTIPANAPLTVRLLQGNVKQDMKFEQAGVDQSWALYRKLITET